MLFMFSSVFDWFNESDTTITCLYRLAYRVPDSPDAQLRPTRQFECSIESGIRSNFYDSSELSVLFERLLSPSLFKFSKSQGIDSNLKKWKHILGDIREVLARAEAEGIKNGEVKRWLCDLIAFAYDAEDLLDEILIDVSTSNHPRLKNHMYRVLDKALNAAHPISGHAMFSIESKMDDLTRRLEMISKRKTELLCLHNGVSLCSNNNNIMVMEESSYLYHKPSIRGREGDEREIVQRLLNGSDDVIPIVGMGGMGKTTLAQIVYDNSKVREHFKRVWVSVSLHFDIKSITKKILEFIIGSSCEGMDLPWLHEKLKEVMSVSDKKFLIVLDNVWDGSSDTWSDFYLPFKTEVPGCKFIVTTRSSAVASRMSCDRPPYHLQQLSADECLSLFAYHALDSYSFSAHTHLQSAGREIAEKCGGCPLLATVLGRALRGKQDLAVWKNVRDAELWNSLEENSSKIPGLMLSYQMLPGHLKPCFAYCSLFPKGNLFDKGALVRLWMAEGFVPAEEEDVGGAYFDDLVSRSFFKKCSREEKFFEMHDLISDLSRVVAADLFLHLGDKPHNGFPPEVRHVSFLRGTASLFERSQFFNQMSRFRTLLALASPGAAKHCHGVSLSSDVLHKLLNELHRVRVFSLSNYIVRELPTGVSNLRHLRSLNLSNTPLKFLPESVTSLVNLQTLLLNSCHLLMKLPQDIENLDKLCELDVADTPMLQVLPTGIGKLTSLRRLCKFIVGKDKGLGIEELANLSKLEGDLCISGLHNVVDEEDAKKANLSDKEGLDDLSMVWSRAMDGSRGSEVEMQVMNSLQPPANLKRLKVEYYGGPKLSSWVGNRSFASIVSVELYDCIKASLLPSLGTLPLLTDLRIRGLHAIETVGSEFYGYENDDPFPSLQTLRFENMPEWKEWLPPIIGGARKGVVKRDFPRLRVLQMVHCPNLIGKLPQGMMNGTKTDSSPLETLELKDCPLLVHFPSGKSMSTPKLQTLLLSGSSSQLEYCIAKKMPDLSISLETIHLAGYSNIKRFPWSMHSLVNLKDLSIDSFSNLKSLPDQIKKLTSLQHLCIKNCQQLGSFPKGGFPPNLTSLSISQCTNIRQPISRWGLQNLTSLKSLDLHEVCVDEYEFPDGDHILPPNITHLSLSRFRNLVRIAQDIQELMSLESLSIVNCRIFQIMEGLPPYLKSFDIRGCPLMQKRCQGIDGDYRKHIINIQVEMD